MSDAHTDVERSREKPQSLREAACHVLGRPGDWKPDGQCTLLEKLYFELCQIACGKGDVTQVPALRLAIEAALDSAGERRARAKSRSATRTPAAMTEEELDAEIAELKAQLGSLPNRHV